MKNWKKRQTALFLLLSILLMFTISACDSDIVKEKSYYSMDEVAEYLHEFKELPPNFLTKSEAGKLGWKSSEGNLWEVTEKGVIGGDIFGNREGLLPKEKGRIYYECDVNYKGGFRGAERIVYSNDGLIFYTDDHYESFKKIY